MVRMSIGSASPDAESGQPASATSPAAAAPLSSNYAERIRGQLNLRHDLAFIADLTKRPGLNTAELGTPITDDELADLQQRRVLVAYGSALEKRISVDPNYAGFSFDQIPGGGWRIALTGKPTPQQVKDVAGLLPAGAEVAYVDVRYTRAELQGLLDEIEAGTTFDMTDSRPLINGASVYGVRNVVEVSFASASDVAAFTERFGLDPRISTIVRPTPIG